MVSEKKLTLNALLEEDRDRVLSLLRADRSPEAALRTLEQETDRLMLRAGELEGVYSSQESAQGLLQVAKNALPLVEAVNETETWHRSTAGKKGAVRRISPVAVLLTASGLLCALGALIGQSLAGRMLRPVYLLFEIAGLVLLAGGGYLAGRGRGRHADGSGPEEQTSQTFLVDPDGVWHVYRGMMLSADHSLEQLQEIESAQLTRTAKGQAILSRAETEFFAELLENAYVRAYRDPSDPSAREQVEHIRYYLHARGIETADYTLQDAARFECLPALGAARTLRPALLSGTTLLKKGLAAV